MGNGMSIRNLINFKNVLHYYLKVKQTQIIEKILKI